MCSISRLYDPNIFLAIVLLKLLVMFIKFTKLIWQDISIRNEIKVLFSESLLHSNDIEAQSVLSSNFVTLREMVDFLVLV